MAKGKRPKITSMGSGGGMSREEAEAIGKRVTIQPVSTSTPTPPPPLPIKESVVDNSDEQMVIVRVRKSFKKRAKAKASALDMKLYEYLEKLIAEDLDKG